MNQRAHSDDVLIVATFTERRDHPQFSEAQIVPISRMSRLVGRRIHTIWLSDPAVTTVWPSGVGTALTTHQARGARLRYIKDWKPEAPSILDQIRALPEANATTGRDFGRGYAKAIKDVVELLLGDAIAEAVA